MFDQEEDFDIDEDFLSTSISNNIISSTQFPGGTNSEHQKNNLDIKPTIEDSTTHFKNTVKQLPPNIFNNDELTDDSFNLDSEIEHKSSQGNKRTFSELINGENTNQCHINAKLKKFVFSPVKRPVENLIVQNNRLPNTSTSFDTFPNKLIDLNNQSSTKCFERKNEINKQVNTKLKQLTNSEQNIQINKTSIANPWNSKTLVQKRKFPGPAGLLPEIKSIKDTANLNILDIEDEKVSNITVLVPICSQHSENLFTQGPWQQMLSDYGSPNTNSLPGKYTISWLKSTANTRQLIDQKSPFLAAIIESIHDNFNVKLKDQTGEIDGVIEKEVWDSYGNVLTVGSVLVLRQVGVLTFSAKKHYLNITANTVVIIYSHNEENLNIDITKGENYVNVIDFTNSINNIREKNRKNNLILKNNSIYKPNFTHPVNNVNMSSNRMSTSNNRNSNFMPPIVKHNNFNSYSTNSMKSMNNRNGFILNQSPQQMSSSSIAPNKKFNFAKTKLISNDNSIRINQTTTVDVNQEGNSDIETIINSTFSGIDADSIFDDF